MSDEEEQITWPAGSEEKRTPPPTPDVLEVLLDPWCYQVYVLLIGLGPVKPADLAEATDLSVFSVVQHLRQLRSVGFAISSEGPKQDRAKLWKVVPGGLVLTSLMAEGEQADALDLWLETYAITGQTHMRRWIRRRRRDEPGWASSAMAYEVVTRLTKDQFAEMTDDLHRVEEKWREIGKDQRSDPDARPVIVQANAFPLTLGEEV